MPDDTPAPDAPDPAPTDTPAGAPPPESPAPANMGGPAQPLTKRAPAGGWAYIGDQLKDVAVTVPGVPARDLTPEDLADLTREGWDLPSVLATRTYRPSPSAAKALAEKEQP